MVSGVTGESGNHVQFPVGEENRKEVENVNFQMNNTKANNVMQMEQWQLTAVLVATFLAKVKTEKKL